MTTENIKGEVGFDKEDTVPEKDFITKEETMFKVDDKGMAIPEKFPVYIYDRQIERELIQEGLMLMEALKKQSAINKSLQEAKVKYDKELKELASKVDSEPDDKVKKVLKRELEDSKKYGDVEDVKSRINHHVIEDSIKESREIIRELNKEKDKQTVVKYVKLSPCNTAESILSFEKGLTVDGKPTDDWVADLISRKVVDPPFTLQEAKNIKPDFKIALKEAIMEASNYKVKSYRDIMLHAKMAEERPLTLKKKITIEESTNQEK